MTYVTMREKRDIVTQKKIKCLMLVSRFNPPLYCVILNDKTLYVWRDGWPNLRYSSRAIEVKNEKALIEISLPV